MILKQLMIGHDYIMNMIKKGFYESSKKNNKSEISMIIKKLSFHSITNKLYFYYIIGCDTCRSVSTAILSNNSD